MNGAALDARRCGAQRAALTRLENTVSNAVQMTWNRSCSDGCLGPNDVNLTGSPPQSSPQTLPSRLAKLDTDDALRACVLARIDHQTFVEITDALAAHFPEDRRVSRSNIHLWWTKRRG